MDVYGQRIINLLMQYFGQSSPFLMLDVLKRLNLKPPIDDFTRGERKLLADTIAETVLAQISSPRKVAMYKSQLYYLLEIYHHEKMPTFGESSKWSK